MKRQKRICYRRGSLTVEAAFTVPMTFLTLILLIVLTFFIHNRVWYTCAALEAAVHANMQTDANGNNCAETAEQDANRRVSEQVMPGTAPAVSVSSDKKATEISYSGQTYVMFQSELTPFQVSERVKRVMPETAVRLAWIGRKLKG